MDKKYIYNLKESTKSSPEILGGKGFYLGQLQKLKNDLDLSFEVPKANILSTDLWRDYSKNPKKVIKLIKEEIVPAILKDFEENGQTPLLSIRSGAPVSMPGMMDTVLNFGINFSNVQEFAKINKEWAYDCLKRYLTMFGSIVLEIPKEDFENTRSKKYKNVKDIEKDFSAIYKKHKKSLPDDNLQEQLFMCIEAVLKSWNSERAVIYRDMEKIDHFIGTAVVVQKMVFGNRNDKSATAVIFSRDITTGDSAVMGEFAINAQGEDVVAGNENSNNLKEFADMSVWNKELYQNIKTDVKKLEKYFKDVLDIELTIEDGKLYFLQSRVAKRTADAAVKIALDLANEGVIEKEEVFNRVKLKDYLNLNVKKVEEGYGQNPDGQGLPASNGVLVGQVVFDARHLDDMDDPSKAILLAKETTPEDMPILKEVGGVYTATGGVTSHAAVVARSLNKICVVGSNDLKVYQEGTPDKWYATIGGRRVDIGDTITLDGFDGRVWIGDGVPITDGQSNKNLLKLEDLFFEVYPVARAVSSDADVFSDKDTVFTTYRLDELSDSKIAESLFGAMEVMSDYQGDRPVEDYVAVIDLRGTPDFASLFSGEDFIFTKGLGADIIERKIRVLGEYSGSKENFSIYLGEYEDQYGDQIIDMGFKLLPRNKMKIDFEKSSQNSKSKNDSFLKIIDSFDTSVLKKKEKVVISGKNAMLSILKR